MQIKVELCLGDSPSNHDDSLINPLWLCALTAKRCSHRGEFAARSLNEWRDAARKIHALHLRLPGQYAHVLAQCPLFDP